ncbi:MAG: PEP-CTERM sorting domain-containing protein [Pirellulaceae bacterium]
MAFLLETLVRAMKIFLPLLSLLLMCSVASADLVLSFSPAVQQNNVGTSTSYDILATSDVVGGENVLFGSASLSIIGDADIVFSSTLTQFFNAGFGPILVTANTVLTNFNVSILPSATIGDFAIITGTFSQFGGSFQLNAPVVNSGSLLAAVPEPTSLTVFSLVAFGCVFVRRRRT